MAMMDCYLVQLDPGAVTLPFRTTANSVCCVVEGAGESQVGSETIQWNKRDIFTLPQGNRIVHKGSGGTARLFQVSDRDLYARLGCSGKSTGISRREAYGEGAAARAWFSRIGGDISRRAFLRCVETDQAPWPR
jgi:gentisate 1,2-dioxygenase